MFVCGKSHVVIGVLLVLGKAHKLAVSCVGSFEGC